MEESSTWRVRKEKYKTKHTKLKKKTIEKFKTGAHQKC